MNIWVKQGILLGFRFGDIAVMSVAGKLNLHPPAPESTLLAQLHPGRENEYRNFNPVFRPEQIEHRSAQALI